MKQQEETLSPVVQQPLPLGYVAGQPVLERPEDLYIPPDALEILLDSFEGPLDLLLYLIRRNKLDVLDLPVQEITAQYLEYIDLMQTLRLELAAEYLLMAAWLAEIKSRLLLPRPPTEDDDEEDPRALLLRRLREYEQFKRKAQEIDELPRNERDFFVAHALVAADVEPEKILPDIDLRELLLALQGVMKRAAAFEKHQISREKLSTRERMSQILQQVGDHFVSFECLFTLEEGRAGAVVTFLAILELVKEQLLELVQGEPFSGIHVRARQSKAALERENGDGD